MFRRLIENNFYNINIFSLFSFAFPSINQDTLKTWYMQLIHLEKPNIIWLTTEMKNGIDFIKSLPYSICQPCSISNLKAKTNF